MRSEMVPRKGPENDHFEQQVKNDHSVGVSSLKCRVGHIHSHSPISLTLPLSSFGWLRNNSSSHRPSASFRNLALRKKFAKPHFRLRIHHLRRSATEAQLGLEFERSSLSSLESEAELGFEFELPRSSSRVRVQVGTKFESEWQSFRSRSNPN